jgi:hypothetical protein
MKKISLLVSLLLLSSCKKNEHVIEIYELKSRAKNLHGISAKNYLSSGKDSIYLNIINENTTIDTLKRELIFADEFLVDINNLKNTPIIKDSEIKFLDTIKNQIEFSESAKKKLSKLKGHTKEGIQFVITDNKKPVMSGYLWNEFSSNYSNWNCISYCVRYKEDNHPNFLYRGIGRENLLGHPIDFKNYKELIKAFVESNRIKK